MLTLLPDLCNFSSLRTYIDISELTIGIFQFLFHLPCEVYLLPSARSIVYTSARTERSICPTNYKEKEMCNRIYKCISYFHWNFNLLNITVVETNVILRIILSGKFSIILSVSLLFFEMSQHNISLFMPIIPFYYQWLEYKWIEIHCRLFHSKTDRMSTQKLYWKIYTSNNLHLIFLGLIICHE